MGGTLPNEFFYLTSLKEFQIANDNFSGRMASQSWSNFTLLEDLDLTQNDFTGPLPDIFLDFVHLGKHLFGRLNIPFVSHIDSCFLVAEELKLQGNRLTGTIPDGICDLRGTGPGEVSVLTVDCNIVCTCCDDLAECD